MTGFFITIEGADGAGKTTHADYIERWLVERGRDVVRTREPGGTELGEAIREIVLQGENLGITNQAELLLIFAARVQHLENVICPALDAGKWVVCDRFTDATYAYQGGGRGIAEERIERLEQWVQGALRPDLTIVFDVPVEVGLARTHSRNQEPDRFEQQALEFKQAVRQVYLDRARQEPGRIRVIDADRSIDEIRHSLDALLLDAFPGERSPG